MVCPPCIVEKEHINRLVNEVALVIRKYADEERTQASICVVSVSMSRYALRANTACAAADTFAFSPAQ